MLFVMLQIVKHIWNKDFVISSNNPKRAYRYFNKFNFGLYFVFWSAISGKYFSCFRFELVLRFGSNPTIDFRIYKALFSIGKRRSGRNWSLVRTEWLQVYVYILDLSILRRLDTMQVKTELWRHMHLPSLRYAWHPDITCWFRAGVEGTIGRWWKTPFYEVFSSIIYIPLEWTARTVRNWVLTWSFWQCLRKKHLVKLGYLAVFAFKLFFLNAFNTSLCLYKYRIECSCLCSLCHIVHGYFR